jgi:hypothetical protein
LAQAVGIRWVMQSADGNWASDSKSHHSPLSRMQSLLLMALREVRVLLK